MYRTALNGILLAAALMGMTACEATSVLRVDTDPQGADIEMNGAFIGSTPLVQIYVTDLGLFGDAATEPPFVFDLTISKRGHVTQRFPQTTLFVGHELALKKTLELRLESIDIGTDPEGVTVLELILDEKSVPAANVATVKGLFEADPYLAAQTYPRFVTQRYIGSTPTTVRYDANDPLEHNDVLLFQKAGYKNHIAYFKATQGKLYVVMQPLVVKER